MDFFKDATRKYILKYSEEIDNPEDVIVSLETLMEKKLIDSNIKNPITNEPYEDIRIHVKKVDGKYTYEILDSEEEESSSEGIVELAQNMIPVYYDEDEPDLQRRWKKADKDKVIMSGINIIRKNGLMR